MANGSIEFRGGDSYRLVACCGYREGKQIKKTRTIHAKSKTDAKKELQKFLNEIDGGYDTDAGKLSFEKFVNDRWIPKYAEKELAPKTVVESMKMLNSRIIPALGHLKLTKIRPSHIIDFLDMILEDGMRLDGRENKISGNTALRYFRLISSILTTAVHWQIIPENPCKRVKSPKVQKQKVHAYSEKQTAKLLDALESEDIRYKIAVMLAVTLGTRRGELLGIEWQHIDFRSRTLKIEQTSQYIPRRGVITKDPKTETSNRLIGLPKSICALLKKYRIHQNGIILQLGDQWVHSNRLFTKWNGEPMHPDTISKWFRKFLLKNNLPLIPFKNLRHTSATLLIANNMPLKNVSARLGHANIVTTANIYADALQSVDQKLASVMDDILLKTKISQ